MTLSNKNKKILIISAIFTLIYTLLPVTIFPLLPDIIFLFYVFFIPYIVFFAIGWSEPNMILVYSYYAIFMVIFWLISFGIIKIIVKIWNWLNKS